MSKIYRFVGNCPGNCGPMPFSAACDHLDHKYIEDAIYCKKAITESTEESMSLVVSGNDGKNWRNLDWDEMTELLDIFGYQLNPTLSEYLVTSVFGYPLAQEFSSHASMTDEDWTKYEELNK